MADLTGKKVIDDNSKTAERSEVYNSLGDQGKNTVDCAIKNRDACVEKLEESEKQIDLTLKNENIRKNENH